MVLYPGAFKPAHQHAPVPQPLLEHPPGVVRVGDEQEIELESWTWKPISPQPVGDPRPGRHDLAPGLLKICRVPHGRLPARLGQPVQG